MTICLGRFSVVRHGGASYYMQQWPVITEPLLTLILDRFRLHDGVPRG